MSAVMAVALTAVLAAIGLLHLAWAFGLRWPAADEAGLVRMVIGRTRGGRMPSRPQIVLVAGAMLVAAALVAAVSVHAVPEGLVFAALFAYAALDVIFLLRGLSGYAPRIWRHTEGTAFYRLNRLYYSPLCLLIAAGLSGNLLLR